MLDNSFSCKSKISDISFCGFIAVKAMSYMPVKILLAKYAVSIFAGLNTY